MIVPRRRNCARTLPTPTCSSKLKVSRSDSWTMGRVAAGLTNMAGTNTPWSSPRRRVMRVGKPSACNALHNYRIHGGGMGERGRGSAATERQRTFFANFTSPLGANGRLYSGFGKPK